MLKITRIALMSTLFTSLISAGGHIEPKEDIETVKEVQTTEKSIIDGLFSSYDLGGSKITLDETYHKALHFGSKIGYTFDNDISIYMLGESNYYRHISDINDMSITALGISSDIPFTANKLSLGVAAGLGTNLNYNRLFNDFRKSYDFGFAYQANMSYNFNKSWSLIASYTKFDFNTNATQLEDTQPEIVSVSFQYKFEGASLF